MPLEIIKNELLSRHTSFMIGGPAKFFVRARSREDLLEASNFIHAESMRYFILGGGSNVLASDGGFDGVVLKNEDRSYTIDGEHVSVSSGAILAMISLKIAEIGLSGLEWAFGVPGTIGGAVRGNAGACGGEMKDVIESVEVLNMRTKEVRVISQSDMMFAYRRSVCVDNPEWMILRVLIKLIQSDQRSVMNKLQHCHLFKKESQPLGTRCAGSMFKNNPIDLFEDHESIPIEYVQKGSVPSGYLIERAGLKGYRFGHVMISDKHANFFINTGGATCEEVVRLVSHVKNTVLEMFGILLEEEIQYIDTQES